MAVGVFITGLDRRLDRRPGFQWRNRIRNEIRNGNRNGVRETNVLYNANGFWYPQTNTFQMSEQMSSGVVQVRRGERSETRKERVVVKRGWRK